MVLTLIGRISQLLSGRRQPVVQPVSVDIDLLHQLASGAPDAATAPGRLRALVASLDADSRSFGHDVAELIDECVRRGVLTFAAPVTGIRIEPTVTGERRDGGFLLMLAINQRITLASPRVAAESFVNADDTAVTLLAVLVETANRIVKAAFAALPAIADGGRA